MSKITQKNKELKGKQAKIAKSKAAKQETNTPEEVKKPAIPNYNKCCTCRYRNIEHVCAGKDSPRNGAYVARKLDGCNAYKCKI